MSFVDAVAEETFKRHPWLFVFIMAISGAMVFGAIEVFAKSDDVEKLETDLKKRVDKVDQRIEQVNHKVDSLEMLVNRRFLQQHLHSLEKEIFELERITKSNQATDRDFRRLDKLRIERNDVNDQLGR